MSAHRVAITVARVHYLTLRAGVECQHTESGYHCCSCTLPYITCRCGVSAHRERLSLWVVCITLRYVALRYVLVWSVSTQTEAIAEGRVHYLTLRHVTCRCGVSGHREAIAGGGGHYLTLRHIMCRCGVSGHRERLSLLLVYITLHYVQMWSVRTQREAIAAARVHYLTLRHITCRCGVSGHRERLSLLLVNITLHYVTLRAGVGCQDTERGYRYCSCTLPYITSHYVQVWCVRTQREAVATAREHYLALRHITCRCGVSGHRERLSLLLVYITLHYVTLRAGVECQDTGRGYRC